MSEYGIYVGSGSEIDKADCGGECTDCECECNDCPYDDD